MTTYYAIIEKATGKMMDGASNYQDNTERPILDSYTYVPLNDEIAQCIVPEVSELADHTDLLPIDFHTTYWNFDTEQWVMFYNGVSDSHVDVDPLQVALDLQQQLIAEAQRYLSIEDLSTAFKSTIQTYFDKLSAIEITEENVLETAAELSAVRDTKPF